MRTLVRTLLSESVIFAEEGAQDVNAVACYLRRKAVTGALDGCAVLVDLLAAVLEDVLQEISPPTTERVRILSPYQLLLCLIW